MDISDCYIAGFFDGEGCITSQRSWTVGKYEKFPRVQIAISIAQKERQVLDLIQTKHGGKIYDASYKRQMYILRINGKYPMKRFLTAIYPYLVVKKEQAFLALQFIETIREEDLGSHGLPEDVHAEREKIHNNLRLLKGTASNSMAGKTKKPSMEVNNL